jgi:outer membrane protein assembly factor BamB
VFAFFPEFGLVAYDFAGKELWRAPLGPFAPIQGIASSPLYTEGNVVVLIDTPEEAYLAAFDARTGKPAWKVERPIGILGSYSTPSLYRPKSGPAQIVVAGGVELTGYQAKTGERLRWARGVTNGPAALPLIDGDHVFTVEPAGEGAPAFDSMAGKYDVNKDQKLDLASEMTGQTLNDEIYRRIFKSVDRNFGNGDGAMSIEEWDKSWDPKNSGGGLVRTRLGGKGDVSKTHVGWRNIKQEHALRDGTADVRGHASPVAADGKIFFASKDGKVTVMKPGSAAKPEWETLGSADLDEQIIATPAIAGNRLYIHAEGMLYCFAALWAAAVQ